MISVNGKTTFKEEFVTCGGISLHQINPNTMESKIHKGLYFVRNIDIDGVTGGFNFQSAWTTDILLEKQCNMNYLSVENLGKNYGERILFEGLTFGLGQGDKMALIANNGTGKSSMPRL